MAHARKHDKPKATVLLVDDHPIVREGVAAKIGDQEDMEVCASVGTAAEALKAMRSHAPDIAVVDLSLRDGSGLELIKDIKIRHPDVKVLVLSMHSAEIYAERTLRAGAQGYIVKDEGARRIVEGIRRVLAGEIYLGQDTSQAILSRLAGVSPGDGASAVSALTDRELEILRLLGQGLGTRQIAEKLHRSVKTIDTHRENIKQKLKLPSARELLRFAIQWAHSEQT